MARLCEGRVAIVTGGGRGHRPRILPDAGREGAKVVVNDLGGAATARAPISAPPQQVVERDQGMGGEAVANGDDVSNWEQAKRMIDQAVSAFGKLDVLYQQCRHPARPHAGQHDRGRVGRGDQGAPEGHLRAGPPRRRLLARPQQGHRRPVNARIINTSSVSGIYGNIGQTNYGAAKMGIAALHHHRRARTAPLRRDRERHRAGRPDPADRKPGGRVTEERRETRSRNGSRRSPSGWRARTAGESPGASSRRAAAFCHRRRLAPRTDAKPVQDPSMAGQILAELEKTARKNAGMNGLDLD